MRRDWHNAGFSLFRRRFLTFGRSLFCGRHSRRVESVDGDHRFVLLFSIVLDHFNRIMAESRIAAQSMEGKRRRMRLRLFAAVYTLRDKGSLSSAALIACRQPGV